MPRYVVERLFPDGSGIPAGESPAIVARNTDEGVTWLHSYLSDDRTRWFCVYEAPSPEAIRRTAILNRLPVDRITQVLMLDPHAYR
jgi:hypothetical protein